jgi:hypothetical protein
MFFQLNKVLSNKNKINLIENSLAVFLKFGFNSAIFSKKIHVFEVNLVLANIKIPDLYN